MPGLVRNNQKRKKSIEATLRGMQLSHDELISMAAEAKVLLELEKHDAERYRGLYEATVEQLRECTEMIQRDRNEVSEIIESLKQELPQTISAAFERKINGLHSKRARKAAEARHSQPGGNRDKNEKVQAEWATGKYKSRDHCAEVMGHKLGMAFSTARRALRNTPPAN